VAGSGVKGQDEIGLAPPPGLAARQGICAQVSGARRRSGGVGSAAGRPGLVAMSWREWARCRGVDPEIFYPPEEDEALMAKEICAGCPVQQVCLDHALTRREKIGVWGGMTERERRRMLRQRRKAS
jgi:WhiB family redox-sensing transcriptional regulator